MMRPIFMASTLLLMSPASAADSVIYSYDALGRMTSSSSNGGPASNIVITIGFDPSGNRSNYKVQGPFLALACSFLTSGAASEMADFVNVSLSLMRENCSQTWPMAGAAIGAINAADLLRSTSIKSMDIFSAGKVEQWANQVG